MLCYQFIASIDLNIRHKKTRRSGFFYSKQITQAFLAQVLLQTDLQQDHNQQH